MPDLLFEIGCEELPAADAASGVRQIAAAGRARLEAARLGFQTVRGLGTPRRLVLHVRGLSDRQAESREWVRGPSEKAAFGPGGEPTPAAVGFARSRGLRVEDLVVRETPQGRYLMAEQVDPGRPAAEVLVDLLPEIVRDLQFPKTMRWGAGDFRFSRPIRWLLALLDDEVVPCRVDGVAAGRLTYGHRVLAPGPFTVSDPDDYFRKMDGAYVVVDPAERRQLIATGVEAVARQAAESARARLSEELLEEVVHLVEFPTAFLGEFDEAFLDLPAAVLETAMRVHQRYFPVESGDGRLLNRFVGVRNGDRQGLDEVARGNERVLRARFTDARFFYEEDRRTPLEARVEELRHITYLEGFGSLHDRTLRLETLVRDVAAELGLSAEEAAAAARAGRLAKADLATRMVYEFPELQGVMGEHYAAGEGEPPAVARAIGEQYLPRGAGDPLPVTRAGVALAVADKLDDLACGFLSGRQPTGSQDPFGLRRQAIGLVRILRGERRGVRLDRLVRSALRLAESAWNAPGGKDRRARPGKAGDGDDGGDAAERLWAFLEGRLRAQMLEEGVRHDVVDAALAGGWNDVARAWWTAGALTRLLQRPDLDDVVVAFRRAANLAEKASTEGPAAPSPGDAAGADTADAAGPGRAGRAAGAGDGADEEERLLARALAEAADRAERALAEDDDVAYFDALAGVRPAVDRFLSNVLVMDPDPVVRHRRLELLGGVARLGRRLGDIGRLAIAGERDAAG